MPGPAKAAPAQGQIRAALEQGLEYLDQSSEYTFQPYTRVVLPVDGFVFWKPAPTVKFKGSLHYGLGTQQNADETAGDGPVLFTSEKQVMTFGQTANPMLYVVTVGENETDDAKKNPVRFAFMEQGNFYAQADLWHYTGSRVMPALATQLLDPGNPPIDQTRAIVSNSLPLWLATNSYVPPYAGLQSGITLYPSYLAAENAVPPYGVVDVVDTTGIGSAPLLNGAQFGAHTQLCRDVVDITLYGQQNNEALTFQDFINQYSLDTDSIGIMNVPVPIDDKRTAPNLKTIAMKKTMRYEVSYYQSISTSVARQLIESALSDFYLNPGLQP